MMAVWHIYDYKKLVGSASSATRYDSAQLQGWLISDICTTICTPYTHRTSIYIYVATSFSWLTEFTKLLTWLRCVYSQQYSQQGRQAGSRYGTPMQQQQQVVGQQLQSCSSRYTIHTTVLPTRGLGVRTSTFYLLLYFYYSYFQLLVLVVLLVKQYYSIYFYYTVWQHLRTANRTDLSSYRSYHLLLSPLERCTNGLKASLTQESMCQNTPSDYRHISTYHISLLFTFYWTTR